MSLRATAVFVCSPLALSLLVIGFAAPAAADVMLVGRTEATIAWPPATQGIVDGYIVYVTRNGGPEIGEQHVPDPRVTIAGQVGDRISVRVRTLGRETPSGPMVTSAPSPPTPVIQFVPLIPPSQGSGLMMSHCAACQKLRIRPVADPSLDFDRFAPPAPWRLVGRGRARFPNDEQLWQHADSGALLVMTVDPSASVVAATSIPGMSSQQALQLAELDGDPEPEIITFYAGGPSLVFWERRGMDILPIGYLVIPTGWKPIGAEDVDSDGKAELFFQWGTPGTVDVLAWSPDAVDWRGRLATGVAGDAAAVADFDGDGAPDLLWQDDAGNLTVSYVRVTDGDVSFSRNLRIPRLPGDDKLEVRGVADVVSTPGLEIVVQSTETFAAGAIVPLGTNVDVRIPLLDPDPGFELVRMQ